MDGSARSENKYGLVLVGSGFASSFFLKEYLRHAPSTARVLVLERGRRNGHDWQIRNERNSEISTPDTFVKATTHYKTWNFTVGFGGGSNCWWGNTPRMLPNDFRLKSAYGVGRDWPVSYDELEPYYTEVEDAMQISGAPGSRPGFRHTDYPLPAHRRSDPELALAQAWPGLFLPTPTARASRPTANRNQCCATGLCHLCPVDAKFTILNGMADVYADPRVSVMLETEVLAIETTGGLASAVLARRNGREIRIDAELVGLGANGLFNPHLLMRSNLSHPLLGRRLHEQMGAPGEVFLDGMDHFQGRTSVTSLGYPLYDGDHRRERAAAMIEIGSAGNFGRFNHLRLEFGRWRQVIPINVMIEDLPQHDNRVELDPDAPERPRVFFNDWSDYAKRTWARLQSDLERVFAPLPVEGIVLKEGKPAGSHVLGTTIMGLSPEDSVVDRYLVHHELRNLLVLGSSVFPTGAPANPTLTLSALSVWAARHLMTGSV